MFNADFHNAEEADGCCVLQDSPLFISPTTAPHDDPSEPQAHQGETTLEGVSTYDLASKQVRTPGAYRMLQEYQDFTTTTKVVQRAERRRLRRSKQEGSRVRYGSNDADDSASRDRRAMPPKLLDSSDGSDSEEISLVPIPRGEGQSSLFSTAVVAAQSSSSRVSYIEEWETRMYQFDFSTSLQNCGEIQISDILLHIFGFLDADYRTLVSVAKVCRAWHERIARSPAWTMADVLYMERRRPKELSVFGPESDNGTVVLSYDDFVQKRSAENSLIRFHRIHIWLLPLIRFVVPQGPAVPFLLFLVHLILCFLYGQHLVRAAKLHDDTTIGLAVSFPVAVFSIVFSFATLRLEDKVNRIAYQQEWWKKWVTSERDSDIYHSNRIFPIVRFVTLGISLVFALVLSNLSALLVARSQSMDALIHDHPPLSSWEYLCDAPRIVPRNYHPPEPTPPCEIRFWGGSSTHAANMRNYGVNTSMPYELTISQNLSSQVGLVDNPVLNASSNALVVVLKYYLLTLAPGATTNQIDSKCAGPIALLVSDNETHSRETVGRWLYFQLLSMSASNSSIYSFRSPVSSTYFSAEKSYSSSDMYYRHSLWYDSRVNPVLWGTFRIPAFAPLVSETVEFRIAKINTYSQNVALVMFLGYAAVFFMVWVVPHCTSNPCLETFVCIIMPSFIFSPFNFIFGGLCYWSTSDFCMISRTSSLVLIIFTGVVVLCALGLCMYVAVYKKLWKR